VFTLDNRGSAHRGTAFEAPLYRQMSLVEVQDQKAGVDFLKTLSFVDGSRVGVMGSSYGGYMTLMAMLQAPETFQVGVAWAPVTDWALYDTHYTERYMGTPRDNAEGYAQANVLHYTQNLRGKLMVMHGLADDNVLPNHSTALFARLQQEGLQYDSILYPGQAHGIRDKALNRHRYNTVLRYFNQHLQP
jgi:dipeptidyl-peptidase-4